MRWLTGDVTALDTVAVIDTALTVADISTDVDAVVAYAAGTFVRCTTARHTLLTIAEVAASLKHTDIGP